jgi:hypothetical protein
MLTALPAWAVKRSFTCWMASTNAPKSKVVGLFAIPKLLQINPGGFVNLGDLTALFPERGGQPLHFLPEGLIVAFDKECVQPNATALVPLYPTLIIIAINWASV